MLVCPSIDPSRSQADMYGQMQRLKASHVLPDVLPAIEPVAEIAAFLPNGKRLLEDTLIMPEDVSSALSLMSSDSEHTILGYISITIELPCDAHRYKALHVRTHRCGSV